MWHIPTHVDLVDCCGPSWAVDAYQHGTATPDGHGGNKRQKRNTSNSKWRIVLCAAGAEEPRTAQRIWGCVIYHHASRLARRLAGRERIWPSGFVVPVRHSRDDEAWHRAETIRVTMYCPVSMTRLLQLEYQFGADCPADLFTVPRPPGICWRCDRRVEKGVYCDDCKAFRRRTYNSWWRSHARAQGKK